MTERQSTIFDPPEQPPTADMPLEGAVLAQDASKHCDPPLTTVTAEHAPPPVWDWLASYIAGVK